MKRLILLHLLWLGLTLPVLGQGFLLPGGIEVSGNTYLEFALSDTSKSRFTESWTDLFLTRGNFRAGFRLGVHEPPVSFASQNSVSGLEHRFLEYRKGGFLARVGNFYSLFGRGLILRSFENRTLRWDGNIDGVKLEYRHRYADGQLIYGQPRKSRLSPQEIDRKDPRPGGERLPALTGGELKLKPDRRIGLGGAYLYSDSLENIKDGVHRWSVFSELNFDYANIYGEYAGVDGAGGNTNTVEGGRGLYFSANLFLGDFTLLGEYRQYDSLAFDGGLTNNPPTVIQEHLYTLLNRRQLIQNSDNEEGYLLQLGYPVAEHGVATVSYSRTESLQGRKVYEDFTALYEAADILGAEWVWGFARQQDLEGRYLNFLASTSFAVSHYRSLKMIFEHQHARVSEIPGFITQRQHYDQLLTLELGLSSRLAFSFLGEHSTDQFADEAELNDDLTSRKKHHFWAGGQLNAALFNRIDLAVFGGTRRKGKVCIGGVCVVKPELEGLEVSLTARL
ncbi:MAG: hypothetical protein KDH97_07890 [Calditrichaeota bacterium]|nr:hypothetical protein [Calditrichota bacterium]MCB0302348.1 hypothetical protein [Calditrichota bacterium]MCB0313048.1 hypothetical protein [Calditrichota bacterium]MCB9089309.1 hypothetical protein [Calditrichia bacterium]